MSVNCSNPTGMDKHPFAIGCEKDELGHAIFPWNPHPTVAIEPIVMPDHFRSRARCRIHPSVLDRRPFDEPYVDGNIPHA